MKKKNVIMNQWKKTLLAVMLTAAGCSLVACQAEKQQEKAQVTESGSRPESEDKKEEETTSGTAAGESTELPDDGGSTPGPEPEPSVTPIPEWIVEGCDIGPATSVTALKEAYGKDFLIGVGLTGSSVRTMMLQSEAMTELVKYHFNSVTMTNLMKPSYLLNQSGSIENYRNGADVPDVKFDTCTQALEFCMENGIQMRGHTLVWHTQVPDWFFREGYESSGEFVDRDTMLKRMESYIEQVITFTSNNYPGVIYCWDVVNEAVETAGGCHEDETGFYIRTYSGDEENLWYKVVGADYVQKAFEFARKYAPEDVKLFYNDYNTFQTLKNEKICALLADLKEKGLVDGIGMQSYLGRNDPEIKGKTGSVQRAIENFAKLGLEIHITELTINIDELTERNLLVQAMRYKEMLQLLSELDMDEGGVANITSVTFFGLMDEYMLYQDNREYSRLFDGQLQPKEALYQILQAAPEQ